MKHLLLGLLAAALTWSAASGYEVMVFGDFHYDSPAVRKNVEGLTAGRKNEMARNLASWETRTPEMLVRAGNLVRKDRVDFAVQLGDLIQGDCGAKELQYKSYGTILNLLTDKLPCPVYVVRGNHDGRGPGAEKTFAEVAVPYMKKALDGKDFMQSGTNFALLHGKDLYLFFDCMAPDENFVEAALKKYDQARYVFFLTHYPVVPCVATKGVGSLVFNTPDNPEARNRLRKLLAARNAIVLCGHIHRTTLFRYQFPEGGITQLSSFSLAGKNTAAAEKVEHQSGKKFFENPVFKELAGVPKYAKLLAEFTGNLDECFEYRPTDGYNVLKVEDSEVWVERYLQAGEKPVERVLLRRR